MLLDIIVTHYKEPWQTGEKFFSMLSQQRGIDFNDIRVILVNDGEENKLPEEYFSGRPYRVEQICIEHAGVSAARNAGQKYATADWVAFCDFDDTFANIYSLRDVLNVLPAPGFDLLWADIVCENKKDDGGMSIYMQGENYVFVHGKYIRRQFLLDNELWFDTEIWYSEDSEWCAILDTVVDHKRVGKIKTDFPVYVWCYTPNSVTTTPGRRAEMQVCSYIRDKKVCEAFEKRMPYERYCAMVARTVTNLYYAQNVDNIPEVLLPVKEDFKLFWKDHKKFYFDTPAETMNLVKKASRNEYTILDKKKIKDISVEEWLRQIEAENE